MSNFSIKEQLKADDPLFSVEFFPPKSTEAANQLLSTAERIQSYSLDFISITYGAGGSTRSRTLRYARKLQEKFGYTVMPHLTCVGHSIDELEHIIAEFKSANIRQIMALRGDPPKNQENFISHPDGLSHANQLVELICKVYPECELGVAGYPEKHPEAPSKEVDLQNLKRKVDAGATFITTQLFFDNTVYFEFVDNCRNIGIDIPILPGIMPVTSYKQILRFCDMCNTSIPDALNKQLTDAEGDSDAVEAIGVEWSYQQVKELLTRDAPGIHLYILNRAKSAVKLMDRLRAEGLYSL